MRKFKSVDDLINTLKPDYPVYCIRLKSIKKSVKFFKDNFPGKILYAVKTNPNEKIIKQIIANGIIKNLKTCSIKSNSIWNTENENLIKTYKETFVAVADKKVVTTDGA